MGNKSSLFDACIRGLNNKALDLIESKDYDSNYKKNGKTCLMVACEKGMFNVVSSLLANDSKNKHYRNKSGVNALLSALVCRKLDILSLLIKDTTWNSKDLKIILNWACYSNQSKIALEILQNQNCDFKFQETKNSCPLFWACYHEMSKVARLLIGHGHKSIDVVVDINTPQQLALFSCINNLNASAFDLVGLPVECSIERVCFETKGLLDRVPEHSSNNSALSLACTESMKDVALSLVNESCSNNNICRSLKQACRNNLEFVALALIDIVQRPIVDSIEYFMITEALRYACSNRMLDVSLALINTNYCDLSHVNMEGKTILMDVCCFKFTKVALALIETKCCYPENVDWEGNTALIISCNNNMPVVSLALLSLKNCLPNQVNNIGYSALMWARYEKMNQVISKILSRPDFVGDKSNNKTTSLITYEEHIKI
jgi:ankyrin repeat protein